MVSNRHAVQCDHFEEVTVKLKIKITVGCGIGDTPELAFPYTNGNARADGTVKGEYFIRRFGLAATAVRRNLHSLQ